MQLTLIAAIGLATPCFAQPADRSDIDRVLQASAADWSRGNLAAFMRSYENAPHTVFVTRNGLLQGYAAIQSHYQAAYAGKDPHRLGQLSLQMLDYRPCPRATPW